MYKYLFYLVVLLLILGALSGVVRFDGGVFNENSLPPSNGELVGDDADEHGCIGSAGYAWCEVKQKCLREWEESCETVQTEKPVVVPSSLERLTAKKWTWVESRDESEVILPLKADRFTLTFDKDMRVSIGTDCNSMGGTYAIGGSSLVFDNLVSTLMFCEGSQEPVFGAMLGEVHSFEFQDGELILKYGGSGVSTFR